MKRHKHHHDWSNRKEPKPMKYETAAPMLFINTGEAYRRGWEAIDWSDDGKREAPKGASNER